MTSYQTSIHTFSQSRTVFEIFDFKVFRVWHWPLTFKGHLGSKIFSPFESPYITSCLSSIDTFSLSRTVFGIYDFKVFRVWPLNFEGYHRSKIFSPFESPCMTSYLTSIDTFYLVSFSRYSTSKCLGFDLDLWPLKVTRSQKYYHFSKAHTRLPILFPLILSLNLVRFSRYQSFQGLTLTFELWRSPEVKKNSPFERPYMTSYLTSIDTLLSRIDFEIFDFKCFRVWFWPLTFSGHLGSKFCYYSKDHTWLPI